MVNKLHAMKSLIKHGGEAHNQGSKISVMATGSFSHMLTKSEKDSLFNRELSMVVSKKRSNKNVNNGNGSSGNREKRKTMARRQQDNTTKEVF